MMTMVMMSVVPMSLIVLIMWAVMMAPTTAMAATTTWFSARKCRGASCRDAALAPEKGASEAAARQRQ